MMREISSHAAIRVCVVSDVRIYREGLALALSRVDDFHVVAIASRGAAALTDTRDASPDIVIVDMGAAGGIEVIRLLRRELPDVKLVAFGVDDTEQDIIACAEIGIAGYVCREASSEELVANVRSAVRDEVICSPKIAASLFRRLASLASHVPTADEALTMREREVLTLIRAGLANKQIAAQLRIAEATVKNHVHNLLEKLQVKRRAQAARLPEATRRRTS